MKINTIESAVRRGHLILRADSLLKHFPFDVNCILSQGVFVAHSLLERIEAQQKPHGERGAGA